MLKTTYKTSVPTSQLSEGWTEHKAPTGHLYYYNANTKESTYDRPLSSQKHGQNLLRYQNSNQEVPDANLGRISHQPYNGPFPGYDTAIAHRLHEENETYGSEGRGEFRGTKLRSRHQDRPKSKNPIPGCEPWVLVKTRLGRRFVYNPDTNESFWKFPPHVMMGVVEFDRLERAKRDDQQAGRPLDARSSKEGAEETTLAAAVGPKTAVTSRPEHSEAQDLLDSEGDEYEEVEITDDDDDESSSKRQKTEIGYGNQTVDFNEDDIAYQLAAMGQDYGLDPGEYGVGEYDELEAGAEGLPLTEEDSSALFKDLLNDYQINPYSTWEKIIEDDKIVEDDRYTVLPNMRARKGVWEIWSRDQIQLLKEKRETEEKIDPRITYFAFLQSYASPKLYWPEFRRKYQKEHEMRTTKTSDKDREKWYREYINRLKLPESILKSDLVKLLNSVPPASLNNLTSIQALPPVLLTDLRYISLRASVREPLISAHISTLSSPPKVVDFSLEQEAAMVKEQDERRRREQALMKRKTWVEENKRKQEGMLQRSKGMLREGAQEIEHAMNVGKDGLLGHMAALTAGENTK